MNTLDYIYGLEGEQHQLFLALHSFITSYEGVNSSIKYGIPFYSKSKILCYINPQKPTGAELVFWEAKKMHYSLALLDFKKRKSMAGITVLDVSAINYEVLDALIQEALQIDNRHATSQS